MKKDHLNTTKIQTTTKISTKTKLLLTFIILISIGIMFAVIEIIPEKINVEDGVIEKPEMLSIDLRECASDDYQEVMGACQPNNQLTISFIKKDNVKCEDVNTPDSYTTPCHYDVAHPPIETPIDEVKVIENPIDSIVIRQCTEKDYEYGPWSDCIGGIQRRRWSFKISADTACADGYIPQESDLLQDCDPDCTAKDYEYTDWGNCQQDNTKRRDYIKKSTCRGVVEPSLPLTESCIYSNENTGGGSGSNNTAVDTDIDNRDDENDNIDQTDKIVDNNLDEINWTLGRWVKTADRSTVYFIDSKNIRHAYPSESIWLSYFDKKFFSNVETISYQELMQYPLGKNVTFKPETLMKIPSVPKVYKVVDSSGKILWIISETTATKLFGNNWNNLVKDLNEVFFNDYIAGGEIK